MTFRNKLVGLLAAFLVIGHYTHAQQEKVSFTVNPDHKKLGVNERLRVAFTMNREGDNFNAPDFSGFNIVAGPLQTISASWTDGVRSFSKTYSYTLTPTAKGRFTIGQATVEVDGKIYKTPPKTIKVTAAVDNPNGTKAARQIISENLHLVAELSKGDPYLNEAVTIVYKLYVGSDIIVNSYRPVDIPTYHNFQVQETSLPEYKLQNGTYRGKPYHYIVLKKVVLYPQKTGELNIAPLSLEIFADVLTDRRDFFDQPLYTHISSITSSKAHSLTVKPPSKKSKPANPSNTIEVKPLINTDKDSIKYQKI